MHKNALFPHKNFKNFLPQTSPQLGRGTPAPYSKILDPPLVPGPCFLVSRTFTSFFSNEMRREMPCHTGPLLLLLFSV